MPVAKIEGIEIYYETHGSGPPLLLFAPGGFDATIAKWKLASAWKQTDALGLLSAEHTLIVYDRRESGKSGGRVEKLTWSTYAREAKGLLDQLNIDSAIVLGGCMGCSVALAFAAQLGATGIQLNNPDLPGDRRWEFMDLLNLVTRIEDVGLELFALENTPNSFFDKAMLGLPGRDEQIENYAETIRNLGRAGIPILGFHWMPNSVWRTSRTTPGRGGAEVTSFDIDLARNAPPSFDREYTAEDMWANLEYFLRAVVPVATTKLRAFRRVPSSSSTS